MRTRTDAYGRVTIAFDDLPEALYAGVRAQDLLVEPGPGLDRFNALCRDFDRPRTMLRPPEPVDHAPVEEHARRAAVWMIPDELHGIDLRAFLVSLCRTPEEEARVHEEMDLFEQRGLEPLLRVMIHLVDHWQRHGVVWGVGRGSSVASFVLYLIGVHRINPLRHGLSIHEFLR